MHYSIYEISHGGRGNREQMKVPQDSDPWNKAATRKTMRNPHSYTLTNRLVIMDTCN
jgi:hypothetical protein